MRDQVPRVRNRRQSPQVRFSTNTTDGEYTPIIYEKERLYQTKVTVINEDARDEAPFHIEEKKTVLNNEVIPRDALIDKSSLFDETLNDFQKKSGEEVLSGLSTTPGPIPFDEFADEESADPLLHYEIILEKSSPETETKSSEKKREEDRNPTADEESSIFDGLSAFTTLDVEAREDIDTMINNMIENSRRALGVVYSTIMENTDFTTDALGDSFAPLGPSCESPSCDATAVACNLSSSCDIYEMCEALKGELYMECDKIQNYLGDSAPYDEQMKDDDSIRKEDTFVDFGALPPTDEKDGKELVASKTEASSGLMSIFGTGGCLGSSAYDATYPSDEEYSPMSCGESKPDIVRCKIDKAVKHINAGIGLVKSSNEKDILISNIDPRSRFASTDLTVGMKVLKINSQPCPQSVTEAFALIKEARGSLEIVASHTIESEYQLSTFTCAPSPSDEEEVEESSHRFSDSIWVPVVNEDGLCSNLDVSEQSPAESTTLVKKRSSLGTFFHGLFSGAACKWNKSKQPAKEPSDKRVTFHETVKNGHEGAHRGNRSNIPQRARSARRKKQQKYANIFNNASIFQVQRGSWAEPIGLKLASGKGGVIVSEIKENSPFRFTGLEIGMRIMEINSIPCPRSLLVATNLIRAAEGDLQLIATNDEQEEKAEDAPVLFVSEF